MIRGRAGVLRAGERRKPRPAGEGRGKKLKQLVIRLNFNSGRTAPLKNNLKKTQTKHSVSVVTKLMAKLSSLTPTFLNLNVFSWVRAFQSHTQVETKKSKYFEGMFHFFF